jgi:RND family efflux transporter MFP subunit
VTVGDAAQPVPGDAKPDGTYVLNLPNLGNAADVEFVFTITRAEPDDLLAGTLRLAAKPRAGAEKPSPLSQWRGKLVGSLAPIQQAVILTLAAVVVGFACVRLIGRRRFVLGSASAVVALATIALLASLVRDPHVAEHVQDQPASASAADSPARLPDASLFVPKTTQRLLDVRTTPLTPATVHRAVNLIGRTIADPHRTSFVQSINGGRVLASQTGLPRIGQVVKQGELLAVVEPSLPLADRTTIAERLGEIEQLIAVAEAKLRRARTLADQQVVPRGQVIDAEAELAGLHNRREVLRATRAEPEMLRAPTSGVIALARVVPGQVVQAQDVLFQIVDPNSVWIEALIYDAIDPATLREASAVTASGQSLTLAFQGFSRTLQQHASVVQFSAQNPPLGFGIGLPLTVIATTGDPLTALVLPREAVVRNANGQSIVWVHSDEERFEPRPVRTEPLDAARVVVAAGVSPGDRIVVRAADLLNQVR